MAFKQSEYLVGCLGGVFPQFPVFGEKIGYRRVQVLYDRVNALRLGLVGEPRIAAVQRVEEDFMPLEGPGV